MIAKNRIIIFHVAIWVIYLLLPLFVFPNHSDFLDKSQIQLITYFITVLFSIGFFYFNYYFTIPKYFFNRKHFLFIVIVLAFIIITILFNRIIINLFSSQDVYSEYSKPELFSNYILRLFLIFAISMGLRFNQRLEQIKSEKIKSELATLKSQINPHFLFNILNDIYGQAIIKSDNTADSITKLSSMMRYVLSETSNKQVPLEKEINYLKSYVELQKIRLTDKTKVTFEIKGNPASKEISPLLFISFVENAFKYGISNEKETAILIRISIEQHSILLLVINEKLKRETTHIDSFHIGMENTIKRLNLIYHEKYCLDIFEDEKLYKINLKIPSL